MKVDKLSVFFPVHNEEKNIPVTLEKAVTVLRGLPLKEYEVLLIENASKDKTPEIVDELARKFPHVKVLHLSVGGYGYALREGFTKAAYEWVVYTDADGQFDFSEVTKFLEKTDQADVIYSYKIKRSDPFFRILAARGWAFSLFLFFGVRLKDIDTGFKMVNKRVLEKIPPLQSTVGGMINAELAIKARRAGFKVTQVPVHHYPRLTGRPTGVKLNVIVQSYLDLLKLWWKLR